MNVKGVTKKIISKINESLIAPSEKKVSAFLGKLIRLMLKL